MGRMYSLSFAPTAATVAVDFFEVNSAAGCSVVLHSIQVGQTTEVGDAQEEFLGWFIKTAHSTSGSGGSAATATALDVGNTMVALSSTCEVMNTTQATGGSPVTRWQDAFNVRAGLLWVPTPETRISIPPSTRLVVGLAGAPADSITFTGTLVFEEV